MLESLNILNMYVFNISFITSGLLAKRMQLAPLKYCLTEDSAHSLTGDSPVILLLSICEVS